MLGVKRSRITAWLALSRPPFHSVGVLPFILGTVMAHTLGGAFRPQVLVLGVLGVVAVMLATYYAGEYWDFEEDTASSRMGRSRFSGGSGVLQRGSVSRGAALRASIVSLAAATTIGAILQFGYHTGPYTLPLGLVGMLGGFFYSTRPIRWVERGWGELWIAFCYGWLPVASAYYIQVGGIHPIVHWASLPIAITIFNVILVNEMPDRPADLLAGKTNLTVRLGLRRASILYASMVFASWAAMLATIAAGVPPRALAAFTPAALLSLVSISWALRETGDPSGYDRLCGATLLHNLLTTSALMLSFAW